MGAIAAQYNLWCQQGDTVVVEPAPVFPDELGSPVPSAGTITCIPERCSSVKLSLPTTGPFSISANPELQGGWIQGEPEVLEMAKTFTPDYFLVVHQIK